MPIQGPPGSGKTYTGARMITEMVNAGLRVGVTANSHKVIRNLLDEVRRAADEIGIDLTYIQKVPEEAIDRPRLRFTRPSNAACLSALHDDCRVAGGTAWLWTRPDAVDAVDVLFVDEGSPNVTRGDVGSITGGEDRRPAWRSSTTRSTHTGHASGWRGHVRARPYAGRSPNHSRGPRAFLRGDVAAASHDLRVHVLGVLRGRLHPRQGLELQEIRSTSVLRGAGLRYLPVAHTGNQSSSPEEAEVVRSLVSDFLASNPTWINREGLESPLTLADILIIAPYNAQVFELQTRLAGARIGTVDKFQGQEAPVVIYSMTTSSHADAPRGMEFLYSLNRLNVATSRAQCLCVLVASPKVFEADCRTPEQMRLANAYCRYLELAQQPTLRSLGESAVPGAFKDAA